MAISDRPGGRAIAPQLCGGRLVGNHLEYAVSQAVKDGAEPGAIYRHFAWFDRERGHWLGEWAGYVPAPNIDPQIISDERLSLMNEWQHQTQALISPSGTPGSARFHTEAAEWDLDGWNECPSGGAICLDVTQFGWPVGDHRWHVWDDVSRMLDWGEEHTFIEIKADTLEVVANQRSHRPIRSAIPGQHVIDITHTPWAQFYGQIFGRFVWREDEGRWGFERNDSSRPSVADVRDALALSEAPIDIELVVPVKHKEGVVVL